MWKEQATVHNEFHSWRPSKCILLDLESFFVCGFRVRSRRVEYSIGCNMKRADHSSRVWLLVPICLHMRVVAEHTAERVHLSLCMERKSVQKETSGTWMFVERRKDRVCVFCFSKSPFEDG